MNFAISDLRERPDYFDVVADRIWRQWWEPRGFSSSYIRERLTENITSVRLPVALVAHDADRFLGTASVIASDLEDLPQFTPWVAAVWTEPEYRKQRIGRALVAGAASAAFALGFELVFLCAQKPRRDFYLRQGWMPLMDDVGSRQVTVFSFDSGRLTPPGDHDD